MAEALTRERPPAEARAAYPGRFALGYLVLVLVFGGLVAGLAVALTRPDHASSRFSDWRPAARGFDAARQIADHVARGYRGPDGAQLLAIQAHRPFEGRSPISAVVTPSTAATGLPEGDLVAYPSDGTVLYVLCSAPGLAQGGCEAPSGASGGDRFIRREGLELALLTLRYMKDVDAVVVLLPPPDKGNWALYLRRDQLRRELGRPLARTLPSGELPTVATTSLADRTATDRLTRARWFRARFEQSAVAGSTLVLDPPVENPFLLEPPNG